ncbi:MAG TPA: zinc-ribbon domain-containing protein [Nitrososphaera sp.]|nr:zinc-ribbon domain-containing protein [Nitrososphaera sp.]
MMAEDMAQKKLRGSGGYVIARITDEEQKKGNLGGPELFLAGIGRLDEDRFVKYHCNKCEKEYDGAPAIHYENPNEELGEGVTLIEKGEYKCRTCSSTIAQYRKFDAPAQQRQEQVEQAPRAEQATPDLVVAPTTINAGDSFIPIQSLVGMSAYDSEAMLIGKVEQVGLERDGSNAKITFKIGGKQVPWEGISKIGDIVLLKTSDAKVTASGRCHACGYQNEAGSAFCAECGTKL